MDFLPQLSGFQESVKGETGSRRELFSVILLFHHFSRTQVSVVLGSAGPDAACKEGTCRSDLLWPGLSFIPIGSPPGTLSSSTPGRLSAANTPAAATAAALNRTALLPFWSGQPSPMWQQQRRLCFCCLSVVLALLLAARSCEAAGASVSLRARWQGTPYLLEAAEFLVRTQAASCWLCEDPAAAEPD